MTSPGADVGPWEDRIALDCADRKSGEVVIAHLIQARHLRGLAADQGAPRLPAALRHAFDHACPDLGIELSTGEIVQEKQRFRPLHDEIVDRHGDEIDADRMMRAGFNRDLELGPDTVGRGHQDRIGEAQALEVEQGAEFRRFLRPLPAARSSEPMA